MVLNQLFCLQDSWDSEFYLNLLKWRNSKEKEEKMFQLKFEGRKQIVNKFNTYTKTRPAKFVNISEVCFLANMQKAKKKFFFIIYR